MKPRTERELKRLREHRTRADDVKLLGRGQFTKINNLQKRSIKREWKDDSDKHKITSRIGNMYQAHIPEQNYSSKERDDVKITYTEVFLL